MTRFAAHRRTRTASPTVPTVPTGVPAPGVPTGVPAPGVPSGVPKPGLHPSFYQDRGTLALEAHTRGAHTQRASLVCADCRTQGSRRA